MNFNNKKQKIGIPIAYTYALNRSDICSMKPINQNVKPSIKTNLKNKTIMKTINLTLTGITISEVLKSLNKNELTPIYLGTDQNYNLLFRVSYDNEKEEIIKKTLKYINDFQQMEEEFIIAVDKALSPLYEIPKAENFIKKPVKHLVINSFYKNLINKDDERQ
jgi:hypothetical protein